MSSCKQNFECLKIVLVIAAVLLAVVCTKAQEGTRAVTSSDFTRNRPESDALGGKTAGAPNGGRTTPVHKPRSYRLTTKPVTTRTKSPGPQTPKNTRPSETEVAQLGVTIWRLRPAQSPDTATRQLVRDEKSGATTAWIPQRVASDTVLRGGDRVRISIESPRDGYLYVVDRDEFADGRSGAINLIFPLAGEDNHVYAGRLIDIPSPDGSLKANPAPNQSGEILSIIVSDKPLSLPLTSDVLPISRAQLQEWEKTWGGATEIWEMEGGAGEAWTPQEKAAAAKNGTRQLTRDDPPPQTIYRVSTSDNQAMLVNVRLKYQ